MSDKKKRAERRAEKRAQEPQKWARIKEARRRGEAQRMQIPTHIQQLARKFKIKNEKLSRPE